MSDCICTAVGVQVSPSYSPPIPMSVRHREPVGLRRADTLLAYLDAKVQGIEIPASEEHLQRADKVRLCDAESGRQAGQLEKERVRLHKLKHHAAVVDLVAVVRAVLPPGPVGFVAEPEVEPERPGRIDSCQSRRLTGTYRPEGRGRAGMGHITGPLPFWASPEVPPIAAHHSLEVVAAESSTSTR